MQVRKELAPYQQQLELKLRRAGATNPAFTVFCSLPQQCQPLICSLPWLHPSGNASETLLNRKYLKIKNASAEC